MTLIEYYRGFNFLFFSISTKEKGVLIGKMIKNLIKRLVGKKANPLYKILNFKNIGNEINNSDLLINEIKYIEYIVVLNDSVLKDIVVKLRQGTSDAFVFLQVLGEAREYNAIAQLVDEHNYTNSVKVIIDAGANVGFTSLFFSKAFPGAKIIAIEPDGDNMNCAQRNFSLNKLNNITLLKCGLWHKKSRLKIQNDFRGGQAWALTVVEDDNGSINGICLDDLLKEYNIEYIDILKMDIEGTEKHIFANLSDTSFLKRTKFLAMEIHDEFNCRKDIYNKLTEHSFSYSESGEGIIAYNKLIVKN